MPARWMLQKRLKIAKAARVAPRLIPRHLMKGVGPNWANGIQYRKDTALDVVEEKIDEYEKSTRRQPVPDIRSLDDIRRTIRDPFFTTVVDNPRNRVRVYWNSERTLFILQWVRPMHHDAKISFAYPSFSLAYGHWVNDSVRWKVHLTKR